jgi:hypothetical protein
VWRWSGCFSFLLLLHRHVFVESQDAEQNYSLSFLFASEFWQRQGKLYVASPLVEDWKSMMRRLLVTKYI